MQHSLPLRDTDILLPVEDGNSTDVHSFDAERSAKQLRAATGSARLWMSDIRWFSVPLLLLIAAGLAMATWATVVDERHWPLVTLQLLCALCAIPIVVSPYNRVHRYPAFAVAFYAAVLALVCTLSLLLMVLTLFHDTLRHDGGKVLFGLVVAVLCLEISIFIHWMRALATINNARIITHHHVSLGRDLNLLSAVHSILPPVPMLGTGGGDDTPTAGAPRKLPKKRD